MKHTPGPWHVQDNDGAHAMIRGKPVPQVHNGETIAKVWLQESDFNDANAHLIATAPEMLEELEFLIRNCIETKEREYADGSPYAVECLDVDPATVKRIRALIAKAKGES